MKTLFDPLLKIWEKTKLPTIKRKRQLKIKTLFSKNCLSFLYLIAFFPSSVSLATTLYIPEGAAMNAAMRTIVPMRTGSHFLHLSS
jgi:hypothetical protein